MAKLTLGKEAMLSSKIAVILPSRGMMFSRTAEELLDNLQGLDYSLFFAHGLSIPNAFNKPLSRALKAACSYFFFLEEDIILPAGTIDSLLKQNVPAIMCDYPMDAKGKAAVLRDPDGNAIYGGTGCLLVTREFLKPYKRPIFHTETAWDIKIGEVVEVKKRQMKGDVYGLHDVNFSLEAYLRGTPIKVSDIACGHRKIRQLGAASTNIGAHDIESWTKLVPNILPRPKKLEMVEITLDDGTKTNVPIRSRFAKGYKPNYVEVVE